MRIVLISASLRGGGAERVLSLMANYWVWQNHEVVFILFCPSSVHPFYRLDPRVECRYVGIQWKPGRFCSTAANSLRIHARLRNAVRSCKPDAVISFVYTTNVRVLLALGRMGIPIIVSERIDPSQPRRRPFWTWFGRAMHARAEAVVVQTREAADRYDASLRDRLVVIPNPVPIPSPPGETPDVPVPSPCVVAMGRLDRQKGFLVGG